MLTNNQLNEPQPKRKTSIKELPKTKEIIMVKSMELFLGKGVYGGKNCVLLS